MPSSYLGIDSPAQVLALAFAALLFGQFLGSLFTRQAWLRSLRSFSTAL